MLFWPWFFSSFSLDKIMFPLLLFFINIPFHSGCRSSYPSIVKSTLLLTSTPTDLPLSFIHPSQDHYPYSFHGVSSWCYLPVIFLPSAPLLFFFPFHLCPSYPPSFLHHNFLCRNLSRCLFFFFLVSHPHSSSLSICKLASDQNLRWQFNESRPS